jgi:hypothetical protein
MASALVRVIYVSYPTSRYLWDLVGTERVLRLMSSPACPTRYSAPATTPSVCDLDFL